MIAHLAMAVALAAPLTQDVSKASRQLGEAISGFNEPQGSAAAERLGKIGDRKAIAAILKGFETSARLSARLADHVKSLALPPDQKKKKESRAALKSARADASKKLDALQSIRAAMTLALRKMRGEEAVAELTRRLTGSGDGGLRAMIATALGSFPDGRILAQLSARLGSERDERVRVAILDVMARRRPKGGATEDRIVEALRDRSWSVVVAAARALGEMKSKNVVQPLIDALERTDGRIRDEINKALVKITGVDKHGAPAAWKDWWERNREAVIAGTYTPEPAERAGGGAGGTTFYGIPVVSKHPIFVIDASMSMKRTSKWKPKEDARITDLKIAGNRKIDVASYELKKVIRMLPDDADFNIVFFHRDVDVFAPHMVRINKANRARAEQWIDALQLQLQTNIWEGVKKAFSFGNRKPIGVSRSRGSTVVSGGDTIFLLSDGKPTTGIKGTKEFCTAVADLNRGRKIVIHTIAIEPSSSSGSFLKKLAQANDGQYAARGGEKEQKKKKKK